MTALLSCPKCHAGLEWGASWIRCCGCKLSFPIVDGIPVMRLEEDVSVGDGGADDGAHKLGQAAYYDHAPASEFEISRPHGTPRLYQWLISEKLRRSVAGIDALTPGWTALTVCGGSGMDAEFLAQRGCRVISSDISLGAARRAQKRALIYGFEILPIVADAEHLPFKERTVDLVYVHDGLHHLSEPARGLEEMARIARRAVSITEPARAAATAVAIRLGISDEVEDAGNRVARLKPNDTCAALSSLGFGVLRSRRYAMYYPHEPGPGFRKLSGPALLPLVKAAWKMLDLTVGRRIGNKLSIVALREGYPH
ncbi:MAG: methyltransferase domain-containing protein [Actinomycetota bacterium]